MGKRLQPRPRRTRQHIIASQSCNYLEKFFVDKGHTVERFQNDYGTDLLVNTFDEDGYAESGDIRIQVRATDRLVHSSDGKSILCRIEVKHYNDWLGQVMPVFLALYDAQAKAAYWLYLQAYFGAPSTQRPRPGAATFTLRVPVANVFTEGTVDYMRSRKAAIVKVEVEHAQ